MPWVLIVAAAVLSLVVLLRVRRYLHRMRNLRRERFIRDYVLPGGLFDALRQHHPQLQLKDCQLVAQGLRQFFLAYHHSGYRYVSMPSQVVDDLWHEFILHTRAYQAFCQQAFGRFFHHTPAAALGAQAAKSDTGLRRTWWHACREENLNPRSALRLPLLFALDAKLVIAAGFIYALDCQGMRRASSDTGAAVYCGSDLSSDSDSGFGHSHSGCGGDGNGSGGSAGDSGGDSSGCGGGGCGGGGGD